MSARIGCEARDEAGGVALAGRQRQPLPCLPRRLADRDHLVEAARRTVEAELAEEVRPVARDLRGGVGGQRPDAAEIVGAGRRADALFFEHGEERRRKERAEIAEAPGRLRPPAERVVDDDQVELLGEHFHRLDAEVAEAPPRPRHLDVGMERGEERGALRQRIEAARVVPGHAAETAGHAVLDARLRAATTRATTGVPVVSVATLVMCQRPRLAA